jgi:hypothetical protein
VVPRRRVTERIIGVDQQAARLLPVTHNNPDVIFSIGNLKYCIAAKRPKSIKAIDKCLLDACNQISRENMSGFIAMDTSLAFSLERGMPPLPELDDVWELIRQWRILLTPTPDENFADIHRSAMNLVIGKIKHTIEKRMENKPVLGIVFNDQIPRPFHDREWGLSGATITYPTASAVEFELVAKQFLKGLPGLQ